MPLFYSDLQAKQLSLVRYLIFHDRFAPIKVVAEHLEVSTKTTLRYAQAIKKESLELFDSPLIEVDATSRFLLLEIPDDILPIFILETLRKNYATESMTFKVLNALFTANISSVTELANHLFITPATAYNYLFKLEQTLAAFDLKFDWNKSRSAISLDYQEKNLRYFIYLFYWEVYHGLDPLQFDPGTPQQNKALALAIDEVLAPNLNIIQSKKIQINYLVAITNWRIKTQNPVELSSDGEKLIALFSEVKDYATIFDSLGITLSHTERLYFNLLIRSSVSEIDDFETRKLIVEASKTVYPDIYHYCHELEAALSALFKLQATEEAQIIFYYSMIFLNLFNLEFDIHAKNELFNTIDFSFFQIRNGYNTDAREKVLAIHQTIAKKYQLTSRNEDIVQLIMLSFITTRPDKTLTVSIQYSRTHSTIAVPYIKNRLLSIFSTDSIEFTTDLTKADLIITDSVLFRQPAGDVFYFDMFTDDGQWETLLNYVNMKLYHIFF